MCIWPRKQKNMVSLEKLALLSWTLWHGRRAVVALLCSWHQGLRRAFTWVWPLCKQSSARRCLSSKAVLSDWQSGSVEWPRISELLVNFVCFQHRNVGTSIWCWLCPLPGAGGMERRLIGSSMGPLHALNSVVFIQSQSCANTIHPSRHFHHPTQALHTYWGPVLLSLRPLATTNVIFVFMILPALGIPYGWGHKICLYMYNFSCLPYFGGYSCCSMYQSSFFLMAK